MTDRPGRSDPPTVTDQYLAAILGELTTIRRQLVQDPPVPPPGEPRLVTEPAPDTERERR